MTQIGSHVAYYLKFQELVAGVLTAIRLLQEHQDKGDLSQSGNTTLSQLAGDVASAQQLLEDHIGGLGVNATTVNELETLAKAVLAHVSGNVLANTVESRRAQEVFRRADERIGKLRGRVRNNIKKVRALLKK